MFNLKCSLTRDKVASGTVGWKIDSTITPSATTAKDETMDLGVDMKFYAAAGRASAKASEFTAAQVIIIE